MPAELLDGEGALVSVESHVETFHGARVEDLLPVRVYELLTEHLVLNVESFDVRGC